MMRIRLRPVRLARIAGALATLACVASPVATALAANGISFTLVRGNGLANDPKCAPNASAKVKISKLRPVNFAEKMTVAVSGFVSGTQLDIFVIQVPNAPFGIAWYVGDLDTSGTTRTFISRFSRETFAVALDKAPAPNTHPGKDGTINPPFKPIHAYHVGIWFNSPADARKNGCSNLSVTPFNGDHTAGIQVLNSDTFPDLAGPLSHIF